MKCVVLEDGMVTNCKLDRTAGYGIDEAALLTIQNEWRFEPGLRYGKPVAVLVSFEVSMRLY